MSVPKAKTSKAVVPTEARIYRELMNPPEPPRPQIGFGARE